MAQESIKLIGAAEVNKALENLDLKTARRLAGRALRAGAKPVLAEVMKEVPVRSGKLKGTIKIRQGRSRKGYRSVVVASQDKGGFSGTDVYYGSFLEFGHRQGSRKLGNKRKQIPGEHFMEHSAEATLPEAGQIVVSTLKQLIEAEASKGGK